MKWVSKIVAGDEKFWVLVLGAIAVYINTGPMISDPAMRTLVNAIIVAMQGWLAANLPPGSVIIPPPAQRPVDATAPAPMPEFRRK